MKLETTAYSIKTKTSVLESYGASKYNFVIQKSYVGYHQYSTKQNNRIIDLYIDLWYSRKEYKYFKWRQAYLTSVGEEFKMHSLAMDNKIRIKQLETFFMQNTGLKFLFKVLYKTDIFSKSHD